MSDDRFEDLLGRLLDEELSPGELEELAELIAEDGGKRERLRMHLQMADRLSQYEDELRSADAFRNALDTRTRSESQDDDFVRRVMASARQVNTPETAATSQQNRLHVWAAVAVSAAAIAASLFLTLGNLQAPATSDAEEPVDSGVAVITQSVDARWSSETAPQAGDTLSPGMLKLESGLVIVEFYSGVTAILEGPAELEVVSARRALCRRGRLRARVPPQAEGFVLELPQVEVVDLGTEFGVQVDADGSAQVHVFNGKVELFAAGTNRDPQSRQELTAGSGIAWQSDGTRQAIPASDAAFVSQTRFEELAAAQRQRRFEQWQSLRDRLRNDPRVLVYYDFTRRDDAERVLFGRQQGREQFNGAIVGCSWASGRWPEKPALEFKRPGDRVRVYLPGEFDSLSFAAWIRVDGLDRAFNTLMLTDGYDLGEPHWQIDRRGRLVLGVKHWETRGRNYTSRSIFNLKRLGQWVHLATVYDHRAGHVRHYLNGRRLHEQKLAEPTQLRIGDAEIGNWGRPAERSRTSIRNFNGRIDELILFQQALAEEDVRELYEAGRP